MEIVLQLGVGEVSPEESALHPLNKELTELIVAAVVSEQAGHKLDDTKFIHLHCRIHYSSD